MTILGSIAHSLRKWSFAQVMSWNCSQSDKQKDQAIALISEKMLFVKLEATEVSNL